MRQRCGDGDGLHRPAGLRQQRACRIGCHEGSQVRCVELLGRIQHVVGPSRRHVQQHRLRPGPRLAKLRQATHRHAQPLPLARQHEDRPRRRPLPARRGQRRLLRRLLRHRQHRGLEAIPGGACAFCEHHQHGRLCRRPLPVCARIGVPHQPRQPGEGRQAVHGVARVGVADPQRRVEQHERRRRAHVQDVMQRVAPPPLRIRQLQPGRGAPRSSRLFCASVCTDVNHLQLAFAAQLAAHDGCVRLRQAAREGAAAAAAGGPKVEGDVLARPQDRREGNALAVLVLEARAQRLRQRRRRPGEGGRLRHARAGGWHGGGGRVRPRRCGWGRAARYASCALSRTSVHQSAVRREHDERREGFDLRAVRRGASAAGAGACGRAVTRL